MPRRDLPLALTAAAYSLAHHLGALPGGLGSAGHGTRIADWLDLLVPLVVLGPALWTLVEAQVPRRTWVVAAVGAWLYVSGHGIHLAANSIGNVAPGPTAHLWDEQVGHWLWYAGVAVVTAALASTLPERARPQHPGAWLLAVTAGATWGTNATGGEFAVPGALLALVALGWGARHRADRGALLAAAGLAGLVGVVVSALVR